MTDAPLVSVVTPVFRPRAADLRACLRSVARQDYPQWEHILVDDGSADPETALLLDEAAAADPRVRVICRDTNDGIVAATNDGLAAARGEWIAFLDQDDEITADALASVVTAAADQPAAELIYSDNAKIDERGRLTERFDKPDFGLDRLRGNMYLAHLFVVRAAAVRELGGLRSGYDGSQDHDLALRVVERGAPVAHIPRVLYLWRMHPDSTAQNPSSKPAAVVAGVRAVQDHLDRTGVRGMVAPTEYPGFYRVDRIPRPGSLATIVIPTRGGRGEAFGADRCFVVEAVRSIESHTYLTDHEYVVVADRGRWVDEGYLHELREIAGDRLRVVPYARPFNFSEKVNLGALHARGDMLVVLNDDIEVLTPGWLDQLVAIAQQDDVGAVGCLLRFDDGTLQHGGHLYGGGEATHAYLGSADPTGAFGDLLLDRETSGVTAACLVQRRDVWWQVGGFTETLPANFNDVDYCMKITEAGYRIVTAGSVELLHFESRTRNSRVKAFEVRRLRARWGWKLDVDPYSRHVPW